MQETATRVPQVLGALRAALTGSSGATVLVGQRTNEVLGDDVLIIGWPDENGASVQHRVSRAPGLGHRYDEVLSVSCVISCVSGSTDPDPLIERAKAIYAAVEDLVKADPTLAGAVDMAQLGMEARWLIGQSPDGAGVEVFFDVVAKSLL